MFPFWGNPCCGYEPWADKEYKKRQLRFLKMLRDGLEARLAGLNAAIATVEQQISQEDSTT
jgi:hypothetical protein